MSDGQLISFTLLANSLAVRRQLARQDRRVEETDALWRTHYNALADRFNRLLADHETLLDWARTVAAERDDAVARVAALRAEMAEQRDKYEFRLELADNRAARLEWRLDVFRRHP